MNSRIFTDALNEIDSKYITEAAGYQSRRKSRRIRWFIAAACLGVLILLSVYALLPKHNLTVSETLPQNGNTLPGALDTYPTVMVNGSLYEWRKGQAVMERLPRNSSYYGSLIPTNRTAPEHNCEFVSDFSAAGEIYTVSDQTDCVYLILTTDWMKNTVIIFDRIPSETVDLLTP